MVSALSWPFVLLRILRAWRKAGLGGSAGRWSHRKGARRERRGSIKENWSKEKTGPGWHKEC